MKKRVLCILLALVMVLALLPASAGAANVLYSGTCGDNATFVITDDGVMTISGTGTVTKPMSKETYKEIQDTVTLQIQSIVIEEGITAVDDNAFYDPSYNLKTLVLPDSLETIGNFAFRECRSLEEIRFGNKLKTIGNGAFNGCNLKTLEIPSSVTSVGTSAFSSNHSLIEVTIPGTIKEIPDYMFNMCFLLKTVIVEEGITSIGKEAFSTNVGLVSIELPETLTSIGTEAFFNCSSLESITIPGSVKTIPERLFVGCRNLKVLILEDGVETLPKYAFADLPMLEEVYLPDTIRTIGQYALDNCNSLEFVRIPAGISTIPEHMFSRCYKLQRVIISSSVTSISKYAFSDCNKLSEIYYAGTEEQLGAIQINPKGNDPLFNADFYLLPAMPDPVFYLYDMPDPDNWAYPGIAFCLYSGLMKGVGDGYFQPDGYTTRAQLVTILWRMMGEPKPENPAPFTDLTEDWYLDAVAWAAENNITKGTSATTFSPDENVTREQMVTIFYRMCKDYLGFDMSPSASLDAFPDNGEVSDWAVDALKWGVAVKLINGDRDASGIVYLVPQGNATRAQIATVMLNFVTAFEDSFFEEDPSDAAPQAPAALPTEGLVSRKGI